MNPLLDFNYMMFEAVGEAGLKRREIDSLKDQLRQIHQGLTGLRKLGQLPFQDLPTHQEEVVWRCLQKGREVRDSFSDILLLGIGGSCLGPRFLIQALAPSGRPRFWICDSVDPFLWHQLERKMDLQKTALMVVSKSGATLETSEAFFFFRNLLKKKLGKKEKEHLFIITDPVVGPLRKLIQEEKLQSFDIPPGVGGRFSVLTPVGLFPAACLGIEIEKILAGAERMDERCCQEDPWFNPAMMSALLHYLFDIRGRKIRVIMPYGEQLAAFAPWFAQLWAESLGKKFSLKGQEVFAGTTPVVASGPQDQHSQLQLYLEGPSDKVVTFVGVEKGESEVLKAEQWATEETMKEAGRPNQTILLKGVSPETIGQLIYMAEMETVYAGELYQINPFDQPAVEKIKEKTRQYLTTKILPQRNRSYLI